MSTKFLSPGWRMPKNANQSKQSNYSLDFDGGQYIDTNYYLPDGTKPKSISYWFKNTDPNGWSTTGYNYTIHGGALSTGAGFGMGALGSNFGSYLWFIGHSTGDYFIPASATGVMTTNVWYHIVVTYDNSRTNNLNFYLDGVKIDETNETLNTSTANSVKIGVSATGGGNSGGRFMQITDVCIFDYALSDGGVSVGSTATGQIAQLYGNGSSLSNPMALPSSPIAYYPLGTSAWNGEYLAENNAIGDYVFDFGTFTSNDRIVINNNFDTIITGTDFTISSWVNLDSVASNQLRFIFTNESLQFTITNKITTYLRGASGYFLSPFDSNTTLSTGKWYNVVLVKSGSDYTYYLNGSADGTVNNSTSVVNSSETTSLIGDYYGAGTLGFDGRISNTQIFNTALLGSEVETLYNYGSPIQTLANIPQSSNLKAWYKLDASEIYNSSNTEWEVDNSSNPSIYDSSINFNSNWMKVYPHGSGKNSTGGLTLPDTYTISWWAKTSLSSNSGFFEGENHTGGDSAAWGNIFRYNSIGGGKYRLWNAGSPVDVTSDIANGAWHHILLTYNSSTTTVTVYTDNVQTFTSSSRNYGTGNNIGRIGSGSDGNSYYNGNMSNISIWDGVVTTSQRDELYNNGAPKDLTNNSNYSNLKHWYIFNSQTTGTRTLIDQKGSNNVLAYSGNTPYFGFVNTLAGESSGMSQANLVQSDLQTVAPYSKYALSFDGTNDYIDCGDSDSFSFGNGTTDSSFSISAWVNMIDATNFITIAKDANSGREYVIRTLSDDKLYFYLLDNINGGYIGRISSGTVTSNQGTWIHTLYTYNGNSTSSGIKIYLNGSQVDNANYEGGSYTAMSNTSTNLNVGRQERGLHYGSGSISNVSIFDSALTSSQVREIYNEGLPSDLNTFSGAAPVAWWQLGSNSSWNGNRWIVADEIGSNNGYSQNMSPYMPESGLTNGVGTTANGVSSGMSEGSLVGDAPYSTANAISSGMAVTARGTDVPPTPTP